MRTETPRALLLLPLLALLAACGREPDVVLYCALDQVHSEPLVREFERRSGLKVRAEYDVEAHKTVGLVTRIREERKRTRCDVFWNNEVAHTVALAKDGLLQAYDSPSAEGIPEEFRDPERRWTGLAARARVYIVNTEKMSPDELSTMYDLVDPRFAGESGMARPLTGTTLTHATALFEVLGEERALEYLTKVKEGVHLARGNAHVMKLVSSGEYAFGWTDTDDYNVAVENGAPVAAVFPDAGPGGIGTLVIPNTVCILKDAPHPEAARKLVDYILSIEVERELASSRSAQIPLHASLKDVEHVLPIADLVPMKVDWEVIGAKVGARLDQLKELFVE